MFSTSSASHTLSSRGAENYDSYPWEILTYLFSFYLGFAVASSSCDVVSRRRAIGFVSALVHRKRGHSTASEIAGESRFRQGRRREHEKVSLFPIKLANDFRKILPSFKIDLSCDYKTAASLSRIARNGSSVSLGEGVDQ